MTDLVRDVATRFAKLRGDRTYDQFAMDSGVSKALLQRYETGGSLPNMATLNQLSRGPERVNTNWIISGIGAMRRKN